MSHNESKPLANWLRHVIDDLKIHDRSRWALLVGVSRQAIGNWINGADLPAAARLASILTLLRKHYTDRAGDLLGAWDELLKAPMSVVWPSARDSIKSLGHYMASDAREELTIALDLLPPNDQIAVCSRVVRECTKLFYDGGNPEVRSGHLFLRDEHIAVNDEHIAALIATSAPEATKRYGAGPIAELRPTTNTWGETFSIPSNNNSDESGPLLARG